VFPGATAKYPARVYNDGNEPATFLLRPFYRQAASPFETDAEGWTVEGDAHLTWVSTGDDPGGYLSAEESIYWCGDCCCCDGDNVCYPWPIDDNTWYWVAPDSFQGNLMPAYRGTLTFDLKQSHPGDSQQDAVDVYLVGGGVTLAFDLSANPGSDWTSYQVPLDEFSGWRLNDLNGSLATKTDLETVLAEVDALNIRGDYNNGDSSGREDTVGLDNVTLHAADDTGWTVRYYRGTQIREDREVTAQVNSEQGWIRRLGPGRHSQLLITVTPDSTMEAGGRFQTLLRAEARRDPSQRDTIRTETQVK